MAAGALVAGATLAMLSLGIRLAAEVRQRLQVVDAELARLSTRSGTDAASLFAGLDTLSAQLDHLSRSLKKDIGSAGRSSREDVSRLRDRLSGRLDEMSQRVSALAERPVAAPAAAAGVSAETPRPGGSNADNRPAASADIEPSAPAPPPTSQPDLVATQQADQGAAWFEAGEYEQARKAFSRVLADHPEDSSARLYYAASLYRSSPGDSSRYAQVEKSLRAALAADPGSVLALDTLASMAIERGRWSEALGHLRKLAEADPGSVRYSKLAGFCAVRAGDKVYAHDFYTAAVDLAPRDAEALTALGDCEWALDNAAEASRDWETALLCLDSASPAGARAIAALRAKIERAAASDGASGGAP